MNSDTLPALFDGYALETTVQNRINMAEQNAKEFLSAIRADMHRQYVAEGQAFVDRVLGDIFQEDIVSPVPERHS